ncbi:MAG: alanine--tRNA ligase [Ruminococcaceae bacterium]|nr:alanine--tRNA ligase [Oscillospiraceae bacterium]
MKWTGLNELREKYLAFFESKDHLRLPSFSLVPQGDKSILLINAGMTPMKKYFTGEVTPPKKRVTTCQKCIRTPDIENVGKTARHGTYFEMLGNFSFGDYFKHEATAWAWEFFTKVLEIPEELLYVSVYLEDDEAYDIWTKEVGVDPSHMVRFGKEDNFWEHGAGPCGPCSEIYFDRGADKGCGSPDCKVGCECDRFIEVWNLVFTQFENDGNNNYTRLANPNIDTGMGLERLACIMQDVENLFEVDTVQNIMKHIIDISGIEYHKDAKKDISLRVITDHIRSTTFMVGDGVLPSNSGRGYVLRRLLRRAARHGRLIGIDRPFLAEVCETVIKENANAYPNLVEKQDYIKKVIAMEEESFYKTIDSGLGLLNEMMANSKDGVLSGEDAFKLQDTFGFPIDLTKEIVAENNMTVDEDAFKKYVEEARMKAKSVKRDGAETDWRNSGVSFKDIVKTEFTGYIENNTDATVVALVSDGERKDFVEAGDAILVLDKTSFYAESGGQVGDTGVITMGDSTFEVTNTTKDADGVVLHHGTLTGDAVKVGDAVVTTYNEENRKAIMRNHTAAHLLQAALRSVLGTHVEQAGQLVDANEVRFDFTHFTGMTGEELKKVEDLVNEEILNATEMLIKEMPIDEAKAMGAMALFGEKYGDVVRVVKAGDFSTELCGGTHVDNTGKIGLFKIVSESSVAAGVRRIQAVTGKNVLKYIDEKNNLLYTTAECFKVGNVSALPQKAVAVANDLKAKEKEIASLKAEINSFKTAGIMAGAIDVNGVQLVVYYAGELDANGLRSMAETARDSAANTVAVIAGSNAEKGTCSFACACGKDAISRGAHAGNIVREVAKVAGGSGGGKPDMAMAGGKDISKIDDALMSANEILKSMLK